MTTRRIVLPPASEETSAARCEARRVLQAALRRPACCVCVCREHCLHTHITANKGDRRQGCSPHRPITHHEHHLHRIPAVRPQHPEAASCLLCLRNLCRRHSTTAAASTGCSTSAPHHQRPSSQARMLTCRSSCHNQQNISLYASSNACMKQLASPPPHTHTASGSCLIQSGSIDEVSVCRSLPCPPSGPSPGRTWLRAAV